MIHLLRSRSNQGQRLRRRSFLSLGASFTGLGLAGLLRAENAAGVGSSEHAVINVHLDGGPPQMDTIDLKPNAPVEVRGEFQPISTAIPGFQVCELLPKLASIADKFVFIRSLVGAAGAHNAFQCQSGFHEANLKDIGGRPAMGSVLAKLKGSPNDVSPPFVDLMQGRPLVRNSARAGFLGKSYQPFRPDIGSMFSRPLEDKMEKELANQGTNHTLSLTLNKQLSEARVEDRASLLDSLDAIRRECDSAGMMDAMDQFDQQALRILLSGRFADAMDLSREDPRVVERFAPDGRSAPGRFVTSDDPRASLKFLLARRLVEAGVRCVSLTISDFDTHSKNFLRMRQILPILDNGLHALVSDLEDRGRLDTVSIVVWGEFGRTPKINSNGGRDHWPQVAPALMAGGGIRCGQVIGATDRTASLAIERPIHYQDVFATLYHNLGIDASRTTLLDPTGRPQYLLERGTPIRELV